MYSGPASYAMGAHYANPYSHPVSRPQTNFQEKIKYISSHPLSSSTFQREQPIIVQGDQKAAQLKDIQALSLKNNPDFDLSSQKSWQSNGSNQISINSESREVQPINIQKSRINFLYSSYCPSVGQNPNISNIPIVNAVSPSAIKKITYPIKLAPNQYHKQAIKVEKDNPEQIKSQTNHNQLQKVKAKQIIQPKIELQIKAKRSYIKLGQQKILPGMVTIKAGKGNKTSADIVCVIDKSGSMQGDKIKLVIETITYLIDMLNQNDRLSIITFNSDASMLFNLTFMNDINKERIKNSLNKIKAEGSTNIMSGLQFALKTLIQRQFVNEATSIFLLSDGQNDSQFQSPKIVFKRRLQQDKAIGTLTLHSFGYGDQHDQDLMNGLSELTDGTFYYIQQLSTIDQAFCNALGSVFSMIASQIEIKLQKISKGIVEDVKILQSYGKLQPVFINDNYQVKLNYLMSESSKDYVFLLKIPQIKTESVEELNREHDILKASFTAKTLNNKIIQGECTLKLTLLNEQETANKALDNEEVIDNYLRVITAAKIKKSKQIADKKNFAEAKKKLQNLIEFINSYSNGSMQKKNQLIKDIVQVKKSCQSKEQWQRQGRKISTNIMSSHTGQSSYAYSNQTQMDMYSQLTQTKQFKSSNWP